MQRMVQQKTELLFFLVSSLLCAVSRADVPRLIHYQGKLVTDTGAIVAGPVDLQARLYDSPTALAPILFDETHSGVALNRGLFSVLLGSQTGGGVPDSVVAGSSVYLGIAVDGAAELSPRIRIVTAPFAAKTRAAEQLVRPGTSTPGAGLDAAGRFGVGTLSPDSSAALHVDSTTGGFMPPSMTESQRNAIASPMPGLLIYNSTSGCINMWTGATWKQTCFDCAFSPPSAGNNGPICEGQTLDLTATTISGATYAWTGPNGFSSSSQNPSISNATTSASGPYSVSATLDGCTGNPVTTLATVAATPSAPVADSNSPVCLNDTLMLTATNVPGATYSWTGPNGFTANTQNPTISNVTAAAAGSYMVEATANGCVSAGASTNVTINQAPAMPGSISGLTTVCANVTGQVYSVIDVPGATSYTWTVPAGAAVASGQGTAFATVNFGTQSGDITVTANNSCGASSPRRQTITVQGGGGGNQTFNFTGGQQSFVVPTCVSSINIQAFGASGPDGHYGSSQQPGGQGGTAGGTLAVTPGETLYVFVGGQGQRSNSSPVLGGFNGGGNGYNNGNTSWIVTGGGGASDVRQGGSALANRVLVAGGGGGGGGSGSWPNGAGGYGGGATGQDGYDIPCCGGGYGGDRHGKGGTQSAGGAGASDTGGGSPGSAGSLGQGGNASTGSNTLASGGGGGYYGGGGGSYHGGGGGGGSSYIGGVSGGSTSMGGRSGDGQVSFTW